MTRSTEQNRRYWMLVSLLADKDIQGQKYNKEAWHLYLRNRFLGAEEIKLPSGKTMIRAIDTHNLPVDQFNDYMGQVEAWAAEHGVWLES